MKKIIFLFFLFSQISFAQEKIEFNQTTSLYEYNHIKDVTNNLLIDDFIKNLKFLNYSNISIEQNIVTGESYFSQIIMGTSLQVHYYVFIEFKEAKYRLTINKFTIDDKRWSPVPLENIKAGKSKWISKINENIPKIIKSLETNSDW